MRRRFILHKDQLPKLVKLTSNPGIDQNYTIENGYRYFDLLVVGGGGAGGVNSGGGRRIWSYYICKRFYYKKSSI